MKNFYKIYFIMNRYILKKNCLKIWPPWLSRITHFWRHFIKSGARATETEFKEKIMNVNDIKI